MSIGRINSFVQKHFQDRIIFKAFYKQRKTITPNRQILMSKYLNPLALFLLLFSFQIAHAFQIEPMEVTLQPVGPKSQSMYKITNPSDKPLAIQVKIATRKQNLDGSELHEEAEDDFLIYPPQMIIKPNSSQKVRIQWLGDTTPESEVPYRFIAEQLPIQLTKKELSGVNMILTVMGTIYIAAPNTKSQIMVDKVEPYNTEKGGQKLALTVSNHGTAHQILRNPKITIQNGDKVLILTDIQTKGLSDMNVLPGSTRRFLIPWPDGLNPNTTISAQLKL